MELLFTIGVGVKYYPKGGLGLRMLLLMSNVFKPSPERGATARYFQFQKCREISLKVGRQVFFSEIVDLIKFGSSSITSMINSCSFRRSVAYFTGFANLQTDTLNNQVHAISASRGDAHIPVSQSLVCVA